MRAAATLAPWMCMQGMCMLACFSEPSDGQPPSTASESATDVATSDVGPATTTPGEGGSGSSSMGSITETADVSGVDTSSESGDPDACPPESRPIPLPLPLGWDGILGLAGGPREAAPTCPDPLVQQSVVLLAPKSQCTCTCTPQCWVNVHLAPGCTDDPADIYAAPTGVCTNINETTSEGRIELPPGELGISGGCSAPILDAQLDGQRRRECVHAAGGSCFSVGSEGEIAGPCVAADGDLPCPEGPYSDRYFVAATATPACGACESCVDAALGACEGAGATLYSEANCGGNAKPVPDTSCSDALGRSMILEFDLACPATTLAPELKGTRTYCCVP